MRTPPADDPNVYADETADPEREFWRIVRYCYEVHGMGLRAAAAWAAHAGFSRSEGPVRDRAKAEGWQKSSKLGPKLEAAIEQTTPARFRRLEDIRDARAEAAAELVERSKRVGKLVDRAIDELEALPFLVGDVDRMRAFASLLSAQIGTVTVLDRLLGSQADTLAALGAAAGDEKDPDLLYADRRRHLHAIARVIAPKAVAELEVLHGYNGDDEEAA